MTPGAIFQWIGLLFVVVSNSNSITNTFFYYVPVASAEANNINFVKHTSKLKTTPTQPTTNHWNVRRSSSLTDSSNDNLTNQPKKQRKIVQVQIIHRHGDRTPITPLKNVDYWKSTLIPEDVLTKIKENTVILRSSHRDKVASSAGTADPIQEHHHAASGKSPGPFGKLTQLGLLQMVDLGRTLREQLLFIGSNNNDDNTANGEKSDTKLHPKNIKVISTDFPRTIQSAQGVLIGLFPDGTSTTEDQENHHPEEDRVVIDTQYTNIMIPDPQPRLSIEQEKLEAELSQRPHLLQREKEMSHLAIQTTRALQHLLAEEAFQMSYGVGEEKITPHEDTAEEKERVLPWAQLAEVTKCLQIRGMLPDVSSDNNNEEDINKDTDIVAAINEYTAWRWFENLRHPRLVYLAMNPFATKIVQTMIDHKQEPFLTLYSAHDSTLIGLLCSFRLQQPSVWPEYGSYLKIELIEEQEEEESSTLSTARADTTNDDHDKSETTNNIQVEEESLEEKEKRTKYFVRFSLNGNVLNSVWDNEDAALDEIPLSLLDHKIRTVGADSS